MTPWTDAIDKLRLLGYSFNLDRGKLRYTYQGKVNPSQDEITPLLEVLRTHKGEILNDPCFLIEQTIAEINSAWKPGTLPWMKQSCRYEWGKMIGLEKQINEKALSGDIGGLKKVLKDYQDSILSMVRVFKVPKGETGNLFDQG